MLIPAHFNNVPTVERLVKVWSDRYFPDLSLLDIGQDSNVQSQLREAASSQGRIQTAEKLPSELIKKRCQLGAIRTRELYQDQDTQSFRKVVRLSEISSKIYDQLLKTYQEESTIVLSSKGNLWSTSGATSLEAWGFPKISRLASTLEPLLLELQEHMVANDWRSIGFVTTQINLTNALLLEELTLTEQVLITPYLNFLEEQVALPWQRICVAAERYDLDSPLFVITEQMLSRISEISMVVFEHLGQSFSGYRSRRGDFEDAKIMHSCLRDFDMFQTYLWLSILDDDSTFIEQELAAVCIMVFDILGIPWKMTATATRLLMDEVLTHLDSDQQVLVTYYTKTMVETFSRA
ncbi:hypothetical protein PN498_06090 [Oscillatoria sp. CS-180]|uniref:hypothetical protein n=1 Tax=Oscillatoria sp. CS-180 TaxID=3021720 RepID=UPI00232CDFEA|nr:hypothetical protein [Oscillatoria sp. CS-180]MDB9525550.1 hypothetical protein [Oscillatoria sp. CS-180]